MERLDLLGVALGLAALAGINLYLTVFATGLAIHFHWITLAPQYQSLEILGNPWIISIAGVLYLLEFFADKIPYFDTIWDAVHTFIRPPAAAVIAYGAGGAVSPEWRWAAALLAGGVALTAHGTKATTRAAVNTVPEPFSNWALSIGEDLLAVWLTWFTTAHPTAAIVIVVALLILCAFLLYYLFRFVRRAFRNV